MIGDIAAVKAAIKAGEVAVANKNCLISSHVIPRLADQVEQMLMKSFDKKEDNPSDSNELNQPNVEETEKDVDSSLDKEAVLIKTLLDKGVKHNGIN